MTISQAQAAFNYEDVTQRIRYEDHLVVYTSSNPLIHETKSLGKGKDVRLYIFADLNERFTQKFFRETFPELKTRLGDKVTFIYRHHLYTADSKNSLKTAQYVECAAAQNIFWSNIPTLIQNSNSLTTKIFGENLDSIALEKCLKDLNTLAVINDQNNFAEKLGFVGIPTFIVENTKDRTALAVKIDGIHEASYYERAVNEIIEELTKKQESQRLKQEVLDLKSKLAERQKPWYERVQIADASNISVTTTTITLAIIIIVIYTLVAKRKPKQ